MVSDQRGNKAGLWTLDCAGGAIVAVCFLLTIWLTLFREDRAFAAVGELSASNASRQKDILDVQAALLRQQQLLASLRSRLAQSGRLPDRAPIEDYFQGLARLALDHRLQVRTQSPRSTVQYAQLVEQRYDYEVAGAMPDLLRFFRAIEVADFWADVSYFKIETSRGPGAFDSRERSAQLTISLFSAPPSIPLSLPKPG